MTKYGFHTQTMSGLWKVMRINLVKQYVDDFKNALEAVENDSPYIITFNTDKIADIDCCKKLIKTHKDKLVHGSKSVYLFELVEITTNKQMIGKRYNDEKLNNKERNFSRINKGHETSQTLYVGSSSSSLLVRFRNHIGIGARKDTLCKGSPKTWSLHLRHWATNLNIDLRFKYIFLNSFTDAQLHTFEDILWEIEKPMFGKKGGK